MSCLTRDMQKQLRKYILRHISNPTQCQPEKVHSRLVQEGVCPSDVTVDQLSMIMEELQHS